MTLLVALTAAWGWGCNAQPGPPGGGGGTRPPGRTPQPTPGVTPTPTPTPTPEPTPPPGSTPTPSPTPTPGPTPIPTPTPPPSLSCAIDGDCNDFLFCNGAERCIFNSCQGGVSPCNAATEECDEVTGQCVPRDVGCAIDEDCPSGQRCDTNTGNCINVGLAACGPGAGNCYVAHFTPGCESPSCCQLLCSLNPECCLISWTDACAEEALQFCPQ